MCHMENLRKATRTLRLFLANEMKQSDTQMFFILRFHNYSFDSHFKRT